MQKLPHEDRHGERREDAEQKTRYETVDYRVLPAGLLHDRHADVHGPDAREIDSYYLRKQLKRSKLMKITIILILILAIGLFICRMFFLYNLYLDGKNAIITHETIVIE